MLEMGGSSTETDGLTRWWFQICFIFTPKIGEDEPNLTILFFKEVETTNQIIQQAISLHGSSWDLGISSWHLWFVGKM